MTQKSKSYIVIDTNKHGIRRETDLRKLASKAAKKKQWEANPRWKKDKKKLNEVKQSLSTDNKDLSTDLSTDI